jgi:hypothetical protein
MKISRTSGTKMAGLASLLAMTLAAGPASAQEMATMPWLRISADALRATDPARYAAADAEVSSLERRRTLSRVALIGGVAVAASALAVGIYLAPDCPSGVYGESPEMTVSRVTGCQRDQNAHFARVSLLTVVAAGPGLVLYGLLRPSRAEVIDVATRHRLWGPQLSFNVGQAGAYSAGLALTY